MAHKSRSAETYSLHIGARGRVVLPARLRKRLKLREGDRMVLIAERDGSLRMVSLEEQLKKLQGIYKDIAPERCLSEELIRERREEARRENDE